MRQHGRKSASALSVVQQIGNLPNDSGRPAPPEHFNEAEAAAWWNVVDKMPPHWFPGSAIPLLSTLVQVTVQLDTVNRALAKYRGTIPTKPERWLRYQQLTKMRGALSTQVASLSTKLRLTPHSRYDRSDGPMNALKREVEQAKAAPIEPWDDQCS
jgi:hypothetical protein